jgi:hypothetical protein
MQTDMRPRGRRFARWSLLGGILVVVVGAANYRNAILTRWHIARLDSSDAAVRLAAVKALMRLRSEAAVPKLAKLLREDLRNMPPEDAADSEVHFFSIFKFSLQRPESIYASALRALGSSGYQAVAALFDDPSPSVRAGSLGDPGGRGRDKGMI